MNTMATVTPKGDVVSDDDLEESLSALAGDDHPGAVAGSALRAFWVAATATPRRPARVSRVLLGGGSCFVQADDGDSISLSVPPGQDAPPSGACISFVITDGRDHKRSRPSAKTIDLQVEEAGPS